MVEREELWTVILGISKISWIEQLTSKQLNEYFNYVDKLLVVVNDVEDVWEDNDRIYYRKGNYDSILKTMKWWAMCRPYPRKTLYVVNYSLVEITEGCTPDVLKQRWLNELRNTGILRRTVSSLC